VVRWLCTLGLAFSILLGSYRLWISGAAVGPYAPKVALSVDGSWHARLGLSTSSYYTALTRVGLLAQEIHPGDGDPKALLQDADALLLAGGGDVDPSLSACQGSVLGVDLGRDRFELALIEQALALDMPILGLCRGLQLLNVSQGGSLRALRDDPRLGPTHGGELRWRHSHSVRLDEGSLLAKLEGREDKEVNSFHGQAIDKLGPSLRRLAISQDGVIEAASLPTKDFVVGLQWHPEILSLDPTKASGPSELAIFQRFAAAATRYQRKHHPL